MNKLITVLIGLAMTSCGYIEAEVPGNITHNHIVELTLGELEMISGRCFEENLNRDDFILCVENDLEQLGVIPTTQ